MNSTQTGSIRKKKTRIGWLSLLSHPAEISGVQVKSLVTPALAGKNPVPHGLLRLRSMQGRYMGLIGQRPKRKVIRLKLKEWLAFKAGYDPGQMRDAHGRWTSGLGGGGPVDRNTHFGRPLDVPESAVADFLGGVSSPEELDKLIRPLPWGPKQQLARKAIQTGARAIDKVLLIPPEYLRTKGKDSLVVMLRDRFYAWGVFDPTKVRMDIETIGSNKQASTFVHEFGHFLETIPIIRGGFLRTGPAEEPVFNWTLAIQGSPEFKAMQALLSNGFVNTLTGKRIRLGKVRSYLRYLIEPSEVWARSFTQYIATHSGNKTIARELKSSTHRLPRYWTPENFVPIDKSLSDIFNVAGLLPPTENKEWVGFKAGYNPGQVRDAHGRWTSGSAAASPITKPSGSKWKKVAVGLAGGGIAAGVAAGVLVAAAVHFRKRQPPASPAPSPGSKPETPETPSPNGEAEARRAAWEWAKTDTYTGTAAHAQDMRNHPKRDTRDQIQEARQRLSKLKDQIKSRRFRKLWYSKIVREERHDSDSANMWNRAMGGTYGGVFGGYLPPRFPRLRGRPNYPRLPPPSTKAYNPNQQRDYHGRWGAGGVQLTGKNRFRAQRALHQLPNKAIGATAGAVNKLAGKVMKPLPAPTRLLAKLVYGEMGAIVRRSGLSGAVRRNLLSSPHTRLARASYYRKMNAVKTKAGYSPGQARDSHGRWSGGSGFSLMRLGAVRHVTGVIRELHHLGGSTALPSARYHVVDRVTVQGLSVEGAYDNQNVYINRHGDTPGLTAAHEIGHLLDHRGLDTPWASENSPHLADWRKAVDDSAKLREIVRWQKNGYIALGGNRYYAKPSVFNYFLNRREQWARSVAQWHATRSNNGRLRRELRYVQRGALPYYWSNRDFQPIYREVDRVMRQYGYTK